MTKKILAFGASSSKNSINKTLAAYVANQVKDSEINLIDLNDYEMPIYSIDKEKQNGVPQKALDFLNIIKDSDGIIISFAEHNGSYSVAFKNIFDWASREVKNVWMNKPMFILGTSPGPGGAKFVLDTAYTRFSHMSSNTVERLSIPNYSDNFDADTGITNPVLKTDLNKKLQSFTESL